MGKAEQKKHTPIALRDSALFPWQPCFVRHNYPKFEFFNLILCFLIDVFRFLGTNIVFAPFLPLVPFLFSFSGAPARRRRASRAPFLRNFGKLIKPRKFGYDVTVRASERANAVRADSGGGEEELRGNANWGTEECHLFMAGFLKKRKLISICHVNK